MLAEPCTVLSMATGSGQRGQERNWKTKRQTDELVLQLQMQNKLKTEKKCKKILIKVQKMQLKIRLAQYISSSHQTKAKII